MWCWHIFLCYFLCLGSGSCIDFYHKFIRFFFLSFALFLMFIIVLHKKKYNKDFFPFLKINTSLLSLVVLGAWQICQYSREQRLTIQEENKKSSKKHLLLRTKDFLIIFFFGIFVCSFLVRSIIFPFLLIELLEQQQQKMEAKRYKSLIKSRKNDKKKKNGKFV